MFTVPSKVIEQIEESLPELLQNDEGWTGFRRANGHLITEQLYNRFGRYSMSLSRRTLDKDERWGQVKYQYWTSSFLYILNGEVEIYLRRIDKKRKNKSRPVAAMVFSRDNHLFYSRDTALLLVPRSSIVYTLCISVRNQRLEEEMFRDGEKLSLSAIMDLKTIFKGYFPIFQDN